MTQMRTEHGGEQNEKIQLLLHLQTLMGFGETGQMLSSQLHIDSGPPWSDPWTETDELLCRRLENFEIEVVLQQKRIVCVSRIVDVTEINSGF